MGGVGVYSALAEGTLTLSDFNNSSIKLIDNNNNQIEKNQTVDYQQELVYHWTSQSKDGVDYTGKSITIEAPEHWHFSPATKALTTIVDPGTGETIATIQATNEKVTITYVTDIAFKQDIKLGLLTDRQDPHWSNIAEGDKVSPVPLKPFTETNDNSVTVHYDAPAPSTNRLDKRPVSYVAAQKKATYRVDIETDITVGNQVDGNNIERNELIFFDTPQRGMQVDTNSYMNLGIITPNGGYGDDLYPSPPNGRKEGGTSTHPDRVILDDGTIVEAYRIFYDMDEKGYPVYEEKSVALKDPDTAAMFESADVAYIPKNLRMEPLSTPANPNETSGVMYRVLNNHQKRIFFYGDFKVFDDSYITGESNGIPTMHNRASYYVQDLTKCSGEGKCENPLTRKSNGTSNANLKITTGVVEGELIYDARVNVTKVDGYGNVLPGAKFSISRYKSGLPVDDKDKKKVTNLVANEQGKLERIESDGSRTPLENIVLPHTTLYLFEDEAPAGYKRMPEAIKLPIQTAETPADAAPITITNYHEVGKIDVSKVDGQDTPIANAVFKLTKDEAGTQVISSSPAADAPGVKLENLTSNAQGKLEVNGKELSSLGIEPGTYYLHETAAPENYESMAAPRKVVVTANITNNLKVVNTKRPPNLLPLPVKAPSRHKKYLRDVTLLRPTHLSLSLQQKMVLLCQLLVARRSQLIMVILSHLEISPLIRKVSITTP